MDGNLTGVHIMCYGSILNVLPVYKFIKLQWNGRLGSYTYDFFFVLWANHHIQIILFYPKKFLNKSSSRIVTPSKKKKKNYQIATGIYPIRFIAQDLVNLCSENYGLSIFLHNCFEHCAFLKSLYLVP